jgi:hypothetical protein
MQMHLGIAYFDTFEEARDVGVKEIKGHPGWHVVQDPRGWKIHYAPYGICYPKLQPPVVKVVDVILDIKMPWYKKVAQLGSQIQMMTKLFDEYARECAEGRDPDLLRYVGAAFKAGQQR